MVRLTEILLMARQASKTKPSWQRVNKHYRFVMSRPWTIQAQIANLPGKNRKVVHVEPVKEWKLMKGDLVQVLKGKDTGKIGTIIDIIRERNWVIVEGLNCHYRRIGKMEGFKGTYVASEAPLLHRQVALIDPSDNQPTEVDMRYTEAGDKVRVSRRTGRIIPTPQMTLKENDHSHYVEQAHDTKSEDVCRKTFQPVMKSVEDDLREKFGIKDKKPPYKTFWY